MKQSTGQILLFVILIVVLSRCSGSGSNTTVTPASGCNAPYTAADKIESSLDPLVFLPGDYIVQIQTGAAPPISVIDPASLPGVVSGVVDYTLTLSKVRSDSLSLRISGRSAGDSFTNYSLGNWAVWDDVSNSNVPKRGNNCQAAGAIYIYRLIRKGGTAIDNPQIRREVSSSTGTAYHLDISLFAIVKNPPTYLFRAEKVAPASLIARYDGKRETSGYWH